MLVCLPLAAPIGLSPLLILTLCGPERVLVVSTEPPDDLSCLTTPGVGRPGVAGGGGLMWAAVRGIAQCPVGVCPTLSPPALLSPSPALGGVRAPAPVFEERWCLFCGALRAAEDARRPEDDATDLFHHGKGARTALVAGLVPYSTGLTEGLLAPCVQKLPKSGDRIAVPVVRPMVSRADTPRSVARRPCVGRARNLQG